ncbi:MAG: glycosyltransferase family 4 protein [candidate division NC10 bacterium]|nr:glycosyltransferase family 4 protein [candidate division NC10 bacterium]MDE2322835.1 glycosyltransferase family 4 protein [candidate division NC10 bacterium]
MRIGIEGKVLTPAIGGIGRYAVNLVKALISISAREQLDVEFVIFTSPQTDRGVLSELQANPSDRFRRVKSTLLRSSLFLPAGLFLDEIDLFHGLDQAGIPFFFKKGRYVVTLHDAIACFMPHTFPLKYRLVLKTAFSAIRRQADLIIVPSESGKEDAVRYLGVERGRIAVIPEGVERRFQPFGDSGRLEAVRQKYGISPEYILFVGALQPRKNIPTLLQAFALLLAEKPNRDLKLVIAGGGGWKQQEIFNTVRSLGLEGHTCFPGYIDDEDLPDLYRGARLFVYPSLYEGFGLPILEAMGCGVPVITSHTSAMPEVAGEAALLVDPTDANALAEAMASVLDDGALRDDLRRKGMDRVRHFSWEAVARKTVESYQALCG